MTRRTSSSYPASPATAKKFEVGRDGQSAAGVPDVDVAITTRELARMIEKAGINFKALPDEKFDQPFDIGSGAGAIFGATGGVMEAALRTAAEVILGKPLEKLEFDDVRGTAPIKRATYKLRRPRDQGRGRERHEEREGAAHPAFRTARKRSISSKSWPAPAAV